MSALCCSAPPMSVTCQGFMDAAGRVSQGCLHAEPVGVSMVHVFVFTADSWPGFSSVLLICALCVHLDGAAHVCSPSSSPVRGGHSCGLTAMMTEQVFRRQMQWSRSGEGLVLALLVY